MNNEQILEAAIKKAYPKTEIYIRLNGWCNTCGSKEYIDIDSNYDEGLPGGKDREEYYGVNELIFSHGFAKAFWGDDDERMRDDDIYTATYFFDKKKRWQAHLVYMVLKEDPIKYLEQFL